MIEHHELERLARNEERLMALQDRMGKVEEKLDVVVRDTHEIKLLVAEIRGGWKVAVRAGALAGSVVGAILALASRLLLKTVGLP